MPVYEVESGGKVYEVDAPSLEEAAAVIAAPAPEAPAPKGFFAGPKFPLNERAVRDLRSAAAGAGRIAAGAGQLVNLLDNALPGEAKVSPEQFQSAKNDFLNALRGRDYPEDAPVRDWLPERAVELGLGIPFGVAGKLGGFWQGVRTAALNSGLGAALFADDAVTLSEKAGSIALGTLAGPLVAASVFGIGKGATGFMPWFVKHQNKNPDPSQVAAVEELTRNFPEFAEQLTFAQRSGSRAGADIETKAAGQYAMRQYRAQADLLKKSLAEYGDKYGPTWNPSEAGAIVAERGQAAVRKEISNLAAIKNAEWNAMIGSAETAVTARRIAGPGVHGSEQVMFDAGEIENTLLQLTEEFELTAQKAALSPAIQRMREEIATFKGQMSIETLLNVLKKTNAENFTPIVGQVTDDTQRAFGKRFRQAVFDSIDEAPDGTSDALTWIKRARQSYAQRSLQRDTFRASAVAKALGLDGPNADPVKAFAAITKASRPEQEQMRRVLAEHDPHLLNELRGTIWRQSMDDATSHLQDPTKSTFDPLAHADTILKLVGTADDRLGGLFTKTDAERIRGVLGPIRAIAFSGQFANRAAELEGTAMSAAGAVTTRAAAAPFVGRAVSRFFWAPLLDEKLFTPAGRASIMKVYQSLGTPKFDVALGRLMAGTGIPEPSPQQE